MNVILNPRQSDTKRGDRQLLGLVDLTGKENLLIAIANDGGVAKFALPTSTNDFAIFVCMSGDAAGAISSGEAPGLDENCRIVLKGACNPGDELSLADPATPADAGKVRKRPTTNGTWHTLFIAEEAGIDGQNILCRRVGERSITI